MAYYKKQFNEKAGVYYPQAVVMGKPIETKKIADRLARISTVSYADVMAVLAELPGVMADYMAQGPRHLPLHAEDQGCVRRSGL